MRDNIMRSILIMLMLVVYGQSQPVAVESGSGHIQLLPIVPEYSQQDIQDLALDWNGEGMGLNETEAITCYDIAIALDPNNEMFWGNKAMNLEKLGKYDEALNCYYSMIRINPIAHRLWTNLGINLQKQGFYNAALMSYDEALRQDPNDETALANRQKVNDYLLSLRV